jgi:YbbR domain-containing protein
MNVPVTFSMDGTIANSKGLSAVGYKDITVDVEIQGMNYEIGAYTANDLVATVNMDSVTKEGTYDLEIAVKSSHSTDQCTVMSITPEKVSVTFDRIASTTVAVDVNAPGVGAADGLTLSQTTVSPEEIKVEGPENELEQIAKVKAVYSDSITISEDTTVSTDSLLFYDADDNVLDDTNFTVSNSSVDITFVVYRKVKAEFTFDYVNAPPNFDLTSLPSKLSQDSIQIISPQLDGSSTETIKLNTVSLYDLDVGKTFSTEIDSLLAPGEENPSGVKTVEVSFDFSDYTKKTFKIAAKNVKFKNVPTGKTAELDSDYITNVEIFGPKDVISKLTSSDLTAYVDLSDVSANGSISHEVVIYSETYNTVWNIGTHETIVTVKDKSTATTSTSTSSSSSSTADSSSTAATTTTSSSS